jgi:transketolase
MSNYDIRELELIAARCRRKIVRMVESSGCGHLGGALSCLDIIVALYFRFMNVDPLDPKLVDRDRFVLSAGHKCMAQYAVLAEKGFFDEKVLDTYGKLNSKIPGHPDMHKLPGVEANTGALGHGLSIAAGMALSTRLKKNHEKIYVIMGDGELAEGSVWEAVAAAAHHRLANLVLFIDDNGLQISGKTTEIMNFEPIARRFEAFGWAVRDIDGNSMQEIVDVLEHIPFESEKPSVVIANTIKSKGLSFAEGKKEYHYWKPSKKELCRAISELEINIKRCEEALGGDSYDR